MCIDQKIQLYRKMKTVTQWKDIEQYHAKCVCQTCTCHKHKCPASEHHIPLDGLSSYQKEYHQHPINTWSKPPPETAKPYQPYGPLDSSYKAHYPGHKPAMREKLKPRVKGEDKSIPFTGSSEYKEKFPGKSVPRENPVIKDRIWTPDGTPFDGETTYNSHYPKKPFNPHEKKKNPEYSFPDGYKFNGETTYNNHYTEKAPQQPKSYKPEEKWAPGGPHDLSSIYRDDYKEKKMPEPCPIHKMPERPKRVHHPHQHLVYNKHMMKWIQN